MGRNNMLKIGSFVIVDEPLFDELHDHRFAGLVIAVNKDTVTVEDQDGDCFDVDVANCVIGE